jgi:hypothetical protein
MTDPVNHPAHYGGADDPYETIKVIECYGLEGSFRLASAYKYLDRAGKKGEALQDLRKALWYLERFRDQDDWVWPVAAGTPFATPLDIVWERGAHDRPRGYAMHALLAMCLASEGQAILLGDAITCVKDAIRDGDELQ